MKQLSTKKMWLFSIGNLGRSIVGGIISSWLVYFYQPSQININQGQTLFFPQGICVFGLFTIIGFISASGRIFDAITDPFVAAWSDRCKSENGRRIPFLRHCSFPLALVTFLVFLSPIQKSSWINALFLFIMLMSYYFLSSMYYMPHNAMIAELGTSKKDRLTMSTAVAMMYILGNSLVYFAPIIWGVFTPALGRVNAIRLTFGIFCVIALFCMLLPTFIIREKDYIDKEPSNYTVLFSMKQTWQNSNFRRFVYSDICYWISITMFQIGLPFVITSVLGLPESMTTICNIVMTVTSLMFYLPIHKATLKIGKKKLVLSAFIMITISLFYASIIGKLSFLPVIAQTILLPILGSAALAIFGILPRAIIADIAEADSSNISGMYYATRLFASKIGMSIGILFFTGLSVIGKDTGLGYRLSNLLAALFSLLGAILLLRYEEVDEN